jgi:hypothetical protein
VLPGTILSKALFLAAINGMVNMLGPPVTISVCAKDITSYYSSWSPVTTE